MNLAGTFERSAAQKLAPILGGSILSIHIASPIIGLAMSVTVFQY